MRLTIMGLNINVSVSKAGTTQTHGYDEAWLERAKQETILRAVLNAGMLNH